MAVNAGEILTVGGANVIDRLQSAGLGNVQLPVETIREVGNRLVVDKVPGEPDYSFSMESLDVSTDLMALLTGKVGAKASGAAPGSADPVGTRYNWEDCSYVNIASPWKDAATGSAGVIEAGHLIPGYYPTRMRQRFGVTDNATQEVELAGGSYYYAGHAPVEEFATGTGAATAFSSTDPAVQHRKGGEEGTTFRNVFGVIVDDELMVEDVDFTVAGGNGTPATITFGTAPKAGALVRFTYFTSAAKDYPQPVHADVVVKPGAVRGRNIRILIDNVRLGSVQSWEMEATIEGEAIRELGNDEVVGRTISGTDCTGTITVRSKSTRSFLELLEQVTGVPQTEVIGYFSQKAVELKVEIENPKDPGQILKTIVIEDAIIQPPGTPARVNTPTDFALAVASRSGSFYEIKSS